MSSDYLEDVEDAKGNVVLLTMHASGFANLTMMDDDKDGEIEGNILRFDLTPDEAGWANASKIANALNEWVEHTKRICT
jgi:hypothetical protein